MMTLANILFVLFAIIVMGGLFFLAFDKPIKGPKELEKKCD